MKETMGLPDAPHTQSDLIAEVFSRERAFAAALKQRDRAGLESILAPEFQVVVGGGGPQITRETWLENAVVKAEYGELEFKGYRASVLGGLVVVDASFEWTVVRRPAGGQSQRYCVTGDVVEVWEKRQGNWQILWRHTTRVAEKPVL
ncbi:MAG TPA: nuclear transport factor 2 family protein [Gammaproteobacteria bacterium]|jgi:hypothetical protein|nr:nuclear transport factor 2 family protein [Gammaproteobacteria bacterium]